MFGTKLLKLPPYKTVVKIWEVPTIITAGGGSQKSTIHVDIGQFS